MQIDLKFITPDAENFIGAMAGICYGSDTNDVTKNIKRAAKCADDGHLATLRFAHAVFHVSGISRVCSHQFVRSKHLDFLQRSQRYCKENNTSFTYPSLPEELEDEFMNHLVRSQFLYNELIDKGVKKEDARFVLPEATHTELVVVGNLQAWLDFIKLRADKHAQWEIREVAKQINNQLHNHCPNIFHWMP